MVDAVDDIWNNVVGVLGEGNVGSNVNYSFAACRALVLCLEGARGDGDP